MHFDIGKYNNRWIYDVRSCIIILSSTQFYIEDEELQASNMPTPQREDNFFYTKFATDRDEYHTGK